MPSSAITAFDLFLNAELENVVSKFPKENQRTGLPDAGPEPLVWQSLSPD
jgi:hypothetical protein